MYKLLPLILILAASALAEDRTLSKWPDQQAVADSLYRKVVDRCCLQKPAALRIKAEINAMVRQGKSEREILAKYRDLGFLDQTAPDDTSLPVWWMLSVIVVAAAAALGIWSRPRKTPPLNGAESL